MARGVIYIAETIVQGLIKIGKTRTENFESRMYELEHNGYRNVTGLKRRFAIEVEGYDEKERLLHTIFGKSRIQGTELFAFDINDAVQLLSSFEGRVIYPKTESKEKIFDDAVDNSRSRWIDNGIYTYTRKLKGNISVEAKVRIVEGQWTLLKGSYIDSETGKGLAKNVIACRAELQYDENGILLEDTELGECSPSFAADVVSGKSTSGWMVWKNKDGQPIDIYRKTNDEIVD